MKNTYFRLKTLEKKLNCSRKQLYTLSNSIHKHYHLVKIPKSDGNERRLYVPDDELKMIQRRINEVILSNMKVSRYAKAYVPGGSPLNNAKAHLKKDIIIKMDIKGYFDHITYPLIKERVFTENRFSEANRILLSILCSFEGILPQGSPASPAISNIILYDFDNEVGKWCRERKITYTRYCDDMTFSGKMIDSKELINMVSERLRRDGFFLNKKKMQVIHNGQRKKITGIVVNEKANATIEYRKKIRQELYYINKFGIKNHIKHKGSDLSEEEYKANLLGKINYILSINRTDEFEKYKTILLN